MLVDSDPSVEMELNTNDVSEREVAGLPVLSSKKVPAQRRLLFVNCYGGRTAWNLIKARVYPTHHLWGCVELVHLGYEVALASPLPDFDRARPLPHDLALLRVARSWLGRDGILYCGHNNFFWLPFLRALGVDCGRMVSLLYAREPLAFAKGYAGVIGLTPPAAEQARRLAPKAQASYVGWGVDLNFFPEMTYKPERFLACGKTHRDHRTLAAAVAQCKLEVQLVCPGLVRDASWPAELMLVTEGGAGSHIAEPDLIDRFYRPCIAALIILEDDPAEETAVGFTNLIEAMALARPVIVTQTGALARELDVEKAGCGLHVPPNDPVALANAMTYLATHRDEAAAMGQRGRQLCEQHYNSTRHAAALHEFFQQL
ncbi:MAG: glycosyltransferase [Bryobacteraceae bacterium]